MMINSTKLSPQRQVRAQLTRAVLLNSALLDSDPGETVDDLSDMVFEGTDGKFDAIYTRLQACLIALDEGIKVQSVIRSRMNTLIGVINPSA